MKRLLAIFGVISVIWICATVVAIVLKDSGILLIPAGLTVAAGFGVLMLNDFDFFDK